MRDVLNREIHVGDVVTYPVRQGGDMWVNIGVVRAITLEPREAPKLALDRLDLDDGGMAVSSRPVVITGFDRVTIALRGSDLSTFLLVNGA